MGKSSNRKFVVHRRATADRCGTGWVPVIQIGDRRVACGPVVDSKAEARRLAKAELEQSWAR